MTQDERWLAKWKEIMNFIETNHRNPSRHNPEERFKYCNWIKHNKKLLNSDGLNERRLGMFKDLLTLMEGYKRINQYV